MKAYEVPCQQVSVRVQLEGCPSVEGVLYAPEVRPGGGPGRVSDRLNDAEECFMPLVSPQGGILLNKDRVVSVCLAERDAHEPDGLEAGDWHTGVTILLVGGERIVGRVDYAMPAESSRLIDYLNATERFLPVHRGTEMTYVNRRFIVQVHGNDAV
ncbi:MAG: hypothetical protein GY716_01205 [bacterium]|nr:hypothetical protein [bacterium]